MIGRLVGTVVEENADGTVVLDVAGVGYEVSVPSGTIDRCRQAADDGRVTLLVHTHVREDAIVLFGFSTQADRTAFRLLIGISNVGPKTALSVLSSLPVGELARVIQARDAVALSGIPGIGKKTADRLILELRDKIGPLAVPGPQPDSSRQAEKAEKRLGLVVDALTRLGFKPAEAERAVAMLGQRPEAEPLDKMIRDALTILRR